MLLESLWGANAHDKYIVAFRSDWDKAKNHKVKTPDQAYRYAQKLDSEGADVYFTPASFRGWRKQDNAAVLPALWVDIDCGPGKPYATMADGLSAYLAWAKQHEFPTPTYIVNSGYGLHLYWILDQPVSHETWLPVAQAFKRAMKVGGLEADPTRTADSASILRIPGTHNHKNGSSVPVEVLKRTDHLYQLDTLRRALPALGPQGVTGKPKPGEWDIPTNYPPGNAQLIADKCQQMRQIRDTRGKVSEPFWRAALSVLHRCENRDYFVHEWSKGDERYNADETEKKAQATGGPATCEHFDEVNPGGCAGCPLAKTITSPIQIQPLPGNVPDDKPWRKTRVGNFFIMDGKLWYRPQVPEGAPAETKLVCAVPIWVVEVRERARMDHESGESTIQLEWITPQGKVTRGVLPHGDLYDLKAFARWCANHTLAPLVADMKSLGRAISQMSAEFLREQSARKYHTTLGWVDNGFVLGNRIVTENGLEKALVDARSDLVNMEPAGDLESWKKAVDVLNQEKYDLQALPLCASFGSILLPLCGYQSAVISLVGPSCGGKTAGCEAALSVYAKPSLLSQAANSTDKAIGRQLAQNKHIPSLLDEVTTMPARRLGNLIYMMVNGEEMSSLTINRQMREKGTWQCTPFVTSNQPILEFSQSEVAEAQRNRVLELNVDTIMTRDDGARLYSGIEHHYGNAAIPFIQAVIKNRERIPGMVREVESWLVRTYNFPDANRFALQILACSMVAGLIAKQLGLIGFDVRRIIHKAALQLQTAVKETETPIQRARNVISEFITEHSKQISRWEEGAKFPEIVDDPIARVMPSYGVVAVHFSRLRQVITDNKVSLHVAERALGDAIKAKKMVRLTPGTAPVHCWLIALEALGMED